MQIISRLVFLELLLEPFICFGGSSVITANEDPVLKAVDQGRTDEWVRLFYERCGETDVVEYENKCGDGNTGPYCNTEVVKTCIGDRDGCIEDNDCYFAVAISETAEYTRHLVPIDPTTTPSGMRFDKYNRTVVKYEVKVLDACHLKPRGGDETEVPEKFVGVAFGPLDNVTSNAADASKLDCNREPTLTDFRVFFFISNFTHCNILPKTPVYPYISNESYPGTTPIDSPVPDNEFTISVNDWKPNECRRLNSIIPPATDLQKNSNFMANLLVYYYGTPNYVKNYDYSDATDWLEFKGNTTLPTYFHPLPKDRVLPSVPSPSDDSGPENGSIPLQPSVFISIPLILSVYKFLF